MPPLPRRDANDESRVVATIQKTYAPSGDCCACLRCSSFFDTYLVAFPPGATEDERALIMAAVLHIDYAYFERTGEENDNN